MYFKKVTNADGAFTLESWNVLSIVNITKVARKDNHIAIVISPTKKHVDIEMQISKPTKTTAMIHMFIALKKSINSSFFSTLYTCFPNLLHVKTSVGNKGMDFFFCKMPKT